MGYALEKIMRIKSNFLMMKKTSLALLVVLLSSLFVFQVTPTKADDPSSESVWVLTETLVNPDNAQLEFIGEEIQPDWAPKKEDGYFEGSFTRYAVTETSFQVDARRVSDGLESHNITFETLFEKPPPKFTPGEIIELTAVSSHGGTAVDFSTPTSEFWYTSKEVFIHPGGSTLWYAPWHDNFDGTNTKTFWFEVPPVTSSRTTFSIAASWRNAEPCLVIWKYLAQEVSATANEDAVDSSGPEVDGVTGTGDTGQDAVNVDDSGGINPWIPVIGIGVAGAAGAAAVAGATAVAISRAKNSSKNKTDEKKKDPCVDDLNRLKEASTQARALFDGIQTLRSYLELLETQYENIRQAAYWNASVDLVSQVKLWLKRLLFEQ